MTEDSSLCWHTEHRPHGQYCTAYTLIQKRQLAQSHVLRELGQRGFCIIMYLHDCLVLEQYSKSLPNSKYMALARPI